LISFASNQYKITAFGIKYLEEEELVDKSKLVQRNEILKILKEHYEKDVGYNVPHEIITEKLGVSEFITLLSQMKNLEDNGYLHLQLVLGGSFWARLTNWFWCILVIRSPKCTRTN